MYTLENQVSDKERLGGKLEVADKRRILDACKATMDWFDDHVTSATKQDFEKQIEELSRIVYPITSKLYKEQEASLKHDEL